MPPSLFVISGRDQGAKFELEDGMMGLGRDSSNFIQVHDTEVSRRHAEIRREGDAYTVIDLGSSNGTFVNGERVGRHALASGDRLQVGSTLILFTDPGDAPAEDLSDKIDIVMRGNVSDNSRIVRSMSQEEGSAIFRGPLAPARGARLDHARSNLQIMYRTTLAVSHTQDIDQLLTRIMQLIFDWVEADRGCVMLLNEETKQLEPKVHHHRQGIATDGKLVISRTILDYVTQRGEGVLTSDARDDDRWTPAVSILKMGVREAICVPMQGRYGMVGVIYIDTSLTPQNIVQQGVSQRFTDEHLKLMIAIAHQAALAVEDTRYHQAMVQAERLAAVGQTIATLSHHIKNILQGIRGGSYLIEMGLSAHDEAVVRKGWGMVERNQNKISSLVMDMLTFSKEREPEPVAGDLNTTVAEVIELMQTRAGELEVALDWHGAPDMPQSLFDPEAIHRAVLNVVTNALDACEKQPEGRVTVSTVYLPTDKLLQIIVQDNGVGIPAEDLEKIFTIFVSQKGNRGTGLGLPVSQKILKEHGGRIRVESQAGVGSRFILELPAVAPDSSGRDEALQVDTMH
ncbi:MAG TPA: ATP-binding protein [Pirellulales bacterium]|nr:ATP-binding protein [Pirellulales bacterium]